DVNPFVLPKTQDILFIREKQLKMIKKNNRLKRKNHVQDKTTFATRIKARIGSMKRFYELDAVDDVEEDEDKDDDKPRKCDPAWMISTVKSCHYDEESLKEYINRTREMFLLQYSLSVKEETMQKMDAIAAKEEENLNQANTHLEESAVAFEEFLKENDKFSVDAVKIAEQETKDKLEKMIEMKKATAQMMNVKSEISKLAETLKEYLKYKEFLDNVAPKEWKEECRERELLKRQKVKQVKKKQKEQIGPSTLSVTTKSKQETWKDVFGSRIQSRLVITSKSLYRSSQCKGVVAPESITHEHKPVYCSSEAATHVPEPHVDLTDNIQTVTRFEELENKTSGRSLHRTDSSKDTKQGSKQAIKDTNSSGVKETYCITSRNNVLKKIKRKEKKSLPKCCVSLLSFSFSGQQPPKKNKMLEALNKKIDEVYRSCIGDVQAQINTLQMLTNIEGRLQELFECLETVPVALLETIEKIKQKENRSRIREERLKHQLSIQEERLRRTMERATADAKKPVGRKLVFRSIPPAVKRKKDKADLSVCRKQDELQYFFT
uniref:DUF4200 domain-containing protein n=1 Tax=Latimeria chalumnae TaxID=7897 RepID=H3A0X7_LATCH